MKYKSAMTTQASGSVDGMTASRNRYGRYMRSRALPINPSTPQQVAVRALMTMYSQQWGQVLTAAQRASWDLYGANVPVVDKLGDSINLPGASWYNACNIPRSQADATNLPAVSQAPAIFDRGLFTPPTVTSVTASTDLLSLAFTAADDWVSEDDAAMLVYLARPQSASRTWFGGPYRLAGVILGDSTTPPTSPASITLPFPIEAGQVLHGQVRVTRADGRLAPSTTFQATATA